MQIKGTKSGLLLHLYERPLVDAVSELRARLEETPDFYRGSRAVLMLGSLSTVPTELAAIVATLEQFGIIADGAVCESGDLAELARSAGLRIVAASVAAAPRTRDDRAGNGEISVARNPESLDADTRYYKGTLRSGQSISVHGHIVVVGDVNAGAELVATGDIIVWGSLMGVAHAGAEGDDNAAVFALRLEPMQLRISRSIAIAPPQPRRGKRTVRPEEARLHDGRIAIDPVRI